MAGLKIKNETVFVIYRNGEPYQKKGRKIVYTSKGAAKRVITTDVFEEVKRDYYERNPGGAWWRLDIEEHDRLLTKVRQQFEVVEYGPKRGEIK